MDKITELYDSHLITDILNKAFMTVVLQFNFTKETKENKNIGKIYGFK